MDFVARNVLKAAFIVIFFVGLFVKAMYSFDDSPYFTFTNMIDVAMAIVILVAFFLIYKNRNWIQGHTNYKVCFALFMACAIIFIVLVPLTPFSDMRAVYEGAINFSNFHWEEFLQDDYWNMFPGNIKLAVFLGGYC